MTQGQEVNSSGKIILEDEEIILFDATGKELEKQYVNEMGEKKRAVLRHVREHVRQTLGVKSEQELQGKKLERKAKEATNKLIKVQKLKQPKLKFIDASGKVVKELQLLNMSGLHKTQSQPGKEDIEVSSENIQVAVVSDLGNIAGVIGMNTVTVSDSRISSTMTFEYFNGQGEKLWSVQGVKPWVNSNPKRGVVFSVDGKRVAMAIAQLPDNTDMELYPNWAIVYDGAGKELARFGPYDQLKNLYLTKNGKYGYFDTGKSTVCFDVEKNVLHEFLQKRLNRELNGFIQVSETGRCTINKYLIPSEFTSQGKQKTKVLQEFVFNGVAQ